jgi:intraflagellar transport protein 172
MNGKIDQSLNTDERGCYEASLIGPDNTLYSPCVITGYPVLSKKMEFKNNLSANVEDWNKFLMISRMAKTDELLECVKFLGTYCDTTPNPNYSFSN